MIFGLYPEFSWSHSRGRQLERCARSYYWNYYGSHNGWTDDAEPEARLAYRLKKLTSLHIQVGSVVHELAAEAIKRARAGHTVDADQLIDRGRDRLNRAWLESKDREAFVRRPNGRTMLGSFYYDDGPSPRTIARVKEKLFTSVPNLLASRSFREAVAAPFVEVEEPDELTSFHLNGFTIFARPDLLYRDEDGMYHLVDWKTGKPSASHLQQLRVYGLFVYSRGDLEAGPMQGHLEYVYAGSRADSAITAAELESQEREIAASVSKMRRYLEDAERNKPLPMSEFPRTNETSECRWCKFYELCGDGS
ncbi:MAG: hypothetical protein GWM93_07075 [Gemmatimonadetes bacterium]|uniref:PD-(D/E)XK nuclease family protein n=1 Tax=Candidatus Kutchimonas denitrificans TaxID=3056748 RepID=A0AAE5CAB4_9BACT|nr:PD-(D/E)XK nuclease family protein [Gemmatimonadota bacterium]NIR74417.1 PD-(D/E)XK nuclease family protein [Candidatus Kutchimonas denitrificans]NIT66437.1 PD-(D/E)XK nuclease family protein [Gemmatimonadota bacterium]NIU52057.1 hypothetical protein [Gemmatimonadota bacterium]NIY35014.1 hypothetical protein [Gemmatimonadota bacterium]